MVIDEIDPNGAKTKGHIYAGGRKIAEQYDPVGAIVPNWDPYIVAGPPLYPDIVQTHEQLYVNGGDPFNYSGGYTLDGLPISEAQLRHMMDTGAGVAGLFFHGKMTGFWDFTGHGNLGMSGGAFWLPDADGDLKTGATGSIDEGVLRSWTNEDDRTGQWVTGYLSFGGGFLGGLAKNQKPQNPASTPLTADEVSILNSDLRKLLGNEICAKFIESVLKQLITTTGRSNYDTTNILTLFEKVKTGRGFDWQPGLDKQARAGGGYDYQGKNVASMSLKPTQAFANLSNASASGGRGRTVIHELFHVAGYDHPAMATAAYAVGGRFDKAWRAWSGPFPDPQNDRFFSGETRAELLDGAYDAFFKNVLDQHCK